MGKYENILPIGDSFSPHGFIIAEELLEILEKIHKLSQDAAVFFALMPRFRNAPVKSVFQTLMYSHFHFVSVKEFFAGTDKNICESIRYFKNDCLAHYRDIIPAEVRVAKSILRALLYQ